MNQTLPLTHKVGEVPEQEEKFAAWSGTFGYYSRTRAASPSFQTDKMLSASFNLEDMIMNRTVCAKLSNKNKSLVEYKSSGNLTGDKPFFNRTNAVESHVNYNYYRNLMKEKGTSENFYVSFQKFQKVNAKAYDAKTEAISYYEVDLVVKDCLGHDAPEFIIGKFKEFCSSFAVRGEVYWKDFCAVIDKVNAAIDVESSRRKELPPLVQLMNRPRIVDKNLIALGDMSSTYRDNFNKATKVDFQKTQDFEYQKPVEEIGRQLDPAAKVLYAGTTKVTLHVPGFRGHIPENMRNTRKFEHAVGAHPHPIVNNLRLTQRGMGCVLGYTGYVPMEPVGSHHERMTSCDPRTTFGATFSGTRSFL